nr:MAG TPA: hypothetical protein [Caudoviricetes sp.]
MAAHAPLRLKQEAGNTQPLVGHFAKLTKNRTNQFCRFR